MVGFQDFRVLGFRVLPFWGVVFRAQDVGFRVL